MIQRERDILERAVRAVSEQAANASNNQRRSIGARPASAFVAHGPLMPRISGSYVAYRFPRSSFHPEGIEKLFPRKAFLQLDDPALGDPLLRRDDGPPRRLVVAAFDPVPRHLYSSLLLHPYQERLLVLLRPTPKRLSQCSATCKVYGSSKAARSCNRRFQTQLRPSCQE